MSEEPSELEEALTRVDQQPAWPITLVGGLMGAVLIYMLALGGDWVSAAGSLALLAVASWLTFTARPLSIFQTPTEVGLEPPPTSRDNQPRSIHPSGLSDTVWIMIPAGSFRMGSVDSKREQPVHLVHVSAFRCMQTPVTRHHYKELIGTDPSWPEGPSDDRPVNVVSWYNAVRFCNLWSERAGLDPCYEFIDNTTVHWYRERDGYRLPTEAEWEYACRSGTDSRWSHGNSDADIEIHAWYKLNSRGRPQPVARKAPNAWGLHDMHGNVWEWCWDLYGDYAGTEQRDPFGPRMGRYRVLRGGAFDRSAGNVRSAFRGRGEALFRDRRIGFRCVRGHPIHR